MILSTLPHKSAHGELLNICLWVVQALISTALCVGAYMKLIMPQARISKIFTWTGQVSESFLRFIGVVDLAGGVGILLPEVTHILPELTPFAALGCVLLQLLAIGFHAQRHEISETPFNFLLLALSGFVLWGRW